MIFVVASRHVRRPFEDDTLSNLQDASGLNLRRNLSGRDLTMKDLIPTRARSKDTVLKESLDEPLQNIIANIPNIQDSITTSFEQPRV